MEVLAQNQSSLDDIKRSLKDQAQGAQAEIREMLEALLKAI